MTFNTLQWGLADNSGYTSPLAHNLRLMRGLSLNGIANTMYGIRIQAVDPEVKWTAEQLRELFEVPLIPTGNDAQAALAEAAKILGSSIPAPWTPATDPTTSKERIDGRFDPVSAGAIDGLSEVAELFDTLVHAWKMEEASGNARVDSKGSLNLAETSGAWGQVAGFFSGFAAYKNNAGSSLLSGSNGSIAPGATPFTVSMWLKFSVPPAGLETIIAEGPAEATMVWRIAANATAVFFASAGGAGNVQNTFPLGDNVWHHVAGRRDDAGVWSCWVDGTPSIGPTAAVAGTAGPVSIGQHAGGTRPVTVDTMSIDEVYIFNSALSDAKMAALAAGNVFTP